MVVWSKFNLIKPKGIKAPVFEVPLLAAPYLASAVWRYGGSGAVWNRSSYIDEQYR